MKRPPACIPLMQAISEGKHTSCQGTRVESLPAVPGQSRSTLTQHTYRDGLGAAARHSRGTLGPWGGRVQGQPGRARGAGAATASDAQCSHAGPGAATPASGTTSWQSGQRRQGDLDVIVCPKHQQDTALRRHKGHSRIL